MEERTSGIILRVRPYTETSSIVQWLTADFGRISTLARGARRTKSLFRGKVDLFYLGELSFQRSRLSTLHTLREVVVREMHPRLRVETTALQQAAYIAHLIELATETDTPIPAIYKMCVDCMALLAGTNTASLVLVLEIKLLTELGLAPQTEDTRMSKAARAIFGQMETAEWSMLSRLRLSTAQFNELKQFLQGFIIYHLGKLPQGRDEALGIIRAS